MQSCPGAIFHIVCNKVVGDGQESRLPSQSSPCRQNHTTQCTHAEGRSTVGRPAARSSAPISQDTVLEKETSNRHQLPGGLQCSSTKLKYPDASSDALAELMPVIRWSRKVHLTVAFVFKHEPWWRSKCLLA